MPSRPTQQRKRLVGVLTPEQSKTALLYFAKKFVEARGRAFTLTNEFAANAQELLAIASAPGVLYGVTLQGMLGNGKTTLLFALRDLTRYLCREGLLSERDILRIVTSQGLNDVYKHDRLEFNTICMSKYLAIDDIGSAPTEVNDYGNVASPIEELLYSRYERAAFTILTTNVPNNQLLGKFSSRIADRLREMYPPETRITFTSKSFR